MREPAVLLRIVPWYTVTLGMNTFFFFLELYLDLRQLVHLGSLNGKESPRLEKWLHVDYARFREKNTWEMKRILYTRLESIFEFVGECAVLVTGALVYLWVYLGSFLSFLGISSDHQIIRGLFFLFLVSLVGAAIRLPFSIYRILFVDGPFKAESMDVGALLGARVILAQWLSNQIKMFLLSVIFGAPCLAFVLWVLSMHFPLYWLLIGVFATCLSFFVTAVYPFFALMFENFVQLPEDNYLYRDILTLSRELKFPLSRVLRIDHPQEERGVHSNAFLMGFRWSKKIVVLYDTLISHLETPEILSVLAHEIGHHRSYHMYKALGIQIIAMACFVYLFSFVVDLPEFYTSFGFEQVEPCVGLVLFSYFYSALANLLHIAQNLYSRKTEFSADRFAVRNGFTNLDSALIKIHARNRINLMPDKLYSCYHFSHPSLVERLEAIHEHKRAMAIEEVARERRFAKRSPHPPEVEDTEPPVREKQE